MEIESIMMLGRALIFFGLAMIVIAIIGAWTARLRDRARGYSERRWNAQWPRPMARYRYRRGFP